MSPQQGQQGTECLPQRRDGSRACLPCAQGCFRIGYAQVVCVDEHRAGKDAGSEEGQGESAGGPLQIVLGEEVCAWEDVGQGRLRDDDRTLYRVHRCAAGEHVFGEADGRERGFECVYAGIDVGAACVEQGRHRACGDLRLEGAGECGEGGTGDKGERCGFSETLGDGKANADASKGAGAGDDGDGAQIRECDAGKTGLYGREDLLLRCAGGNGLFGEWRFRRIRVEESNVAGVATGVEDQDEAHGFMVVLAKELGRYARQRRTAASHGNIRAMCGVYRCRGLCPMRSCSHAILVVSCMAVLPFSLAAQAVRRVPVDSLPKAGQQALPIKRVALYKNGVGFFEHVGTVRGDGAVRIDFTTAQLNDVLQSLTAVDLGGGRIAGAGYNSTTPLEQQLRSLPLGLSADPTAADLYAAVRGAQVEVTGAGAPVTGRILNVELRDTVKAVGTDGAMAQRSFLTVVSDAGVVRTVELTGTTQVRLLDGELRGDLGRYLQTLAGNHADGLRHLTLMDRGIGERELRVSYISEVPVWKCTYRILFNGAAKAGAIKTATLQGWAVIDNTVGTDWNGVQLSLVAGAPQSFLQPLSQPYYARRPEIGLPQEAQLTPQTHESGESAKVVGALDDMTAPVSPPAQPVSSGVAVAGMGASAGVMGGLGLNTATLATKQRGSGSGSGSGNGLGDGQGTGGDMYASAAAASIDYEDSASASIAPHASAAAFDDYFEYKLNEPVTIKKNESALVPILQAKVEVDPVTLWSPGGQPPLRALWVKNTSELTLDRGSFSIVEGGNFSGQGLLDPIHPGERRLLSYAADEAVRVSTDYSHDTQKLERITISKGILKQEVAEVVEVEYQVHNASSEARTVIVEQPRRKGWALDSDRKPEETTESLYRFRVVTAPAETVRLHIGERHTRTTRYAVANFDEQQMTAILRQTGDAGAALAALQPVFAAKRRVADLDAHLAARNAEIALITQDQERLRENLKALKGTAEERDLTRRYTGELNAQEDRLVSLQGEVKALGTEHTAAAAVLATAVENATLQPLT